MSNEMAIKQPPKKLAANNHNQPPTKSLRTLSPLKKSCSSLHQKKPYQKKHGYPDAAALLGAMARTSDNHGSIECQTKNTSEVSQSHVSNVLHPLHSSRKYKIPKRRRKNKLCDTVGQASLPSPNLEKHIAKTPSSSSKESTLSESDVTFLRLQKPSPCGGIAFESLGNVFRTSQTSSVASPMSAVSNTTQKYLKRSATDSCFDNGSSLEHVNNSNYQCQDEEMEDLLETVSRSRSQESILKNFRGKYVVVDTNIYLRNLNFVENLLRQDLESISVKVYLPWIVIQELDKIKNVKNHSKATKANKANKLLFSYLSTNSPKIRGQSVVEAREKPDCFPEDGFNVPDDYLLHSCLQLKEEGAEVLLLSCDNNLKLKASVNSVPAYSLPDDEEQFLTCLGLSPAKKVKTVTNSAMKTVSKDISTLGKKMGRKDGKKSSFQESNKSQEKKIFIDFQTKNKSIADSSDSKKKGEKNLKNCVIGIVEEILNPIFKTELQNAYEDYWIRIAGHGPPWTCAEMLSCINKCQTSLQGTALGNCKKEVESLLNCVRNSDYADSNKLHEEAVALCLKLQSHYCDIAPAVSKLKDLRTQSNLARERGNKSNESAACSSRGNLSVQEVTSAFQLFNYSWKMLNDLCGNICCTLQQPYPYSYDFRKYNYSGKAELQGIYRNILHAKEYMERLMKDSRYPQNECLYKALINKLIEIVSHLCGKVNEKEPVSSISAEDMALFFNKPENRELIKSGFQQMVAFHEALAKCILEIL